MTQLEFVNSLPTLRDRCYNDRAFETKLKKLGFKIIGRGCSKTVYSKKYFRYVIKVGDVTEHTGHIRYRKRRKQLLPIVTHGIGFVVQKKVKPCGKVNCYVSGFWDGHWNNHTHINGKKVMFDY